MSRRPKQKPISFQEFIRLLKEEAMKAPPSVMTEITSLLIAQEIAHTTNGTPDFTLKGMALLRACIVAAVEKRNPLQIPEDLRLDILTFAAYYDLLKMPGETLH